MEVPSSWDALRKQARKLEAQLDEQMNSYRKLVSAKASSKVDNAESDMESWIERLLKQLQQVNSQMQAWVSSGGTEMVSHTLTRHQEILQDLTQEFYRLRSSLRAKQEHASLLEDFKEFDRTRLDLEEGGGSAEQALLKEHASISRSTGQIVGVLMRIKKKFVSVPACSKRKKERWTMLFHKHKPHLVHLSPNVRLLVESIQSSVMSAVAFQR
ncbi:Golgi SNAP receptor complex member 1-1-like isoform X2 [Prosopis cineraria]|uniref:Golgi SNAP receptor complex member 1-1-like isoform X2 n=1 Tax=Prosopis cineraria TaxID=364024 RepID=UPI002410632A|nr:Golgi SNAP receptor complex member 1-1-like isoform X2 [Prosopis cineraria]XP_054795056.1 Golgi SNAP receptor complex member 1-1-like isoform X2 [Prosopis cineraria]